jgi:hypothetical protein
MMLLHDPVFHGALMAQPVLLHHDLAPKGKPHGARPRHWVFSHGAPMAQRGIAALRFAPLCEAARPRRRPVKFNKGRRDE